MYKVFLTLPCPPNSRASLSSATLYFPGKSHPTLYLFVQDNTCHSKNQVLNKELGMLLFRQETTFLVQTTHRQIPCITIKNIVPIICILWMKIEHKNQISTLKDDNLQHYKIMQLLFNSKEFSNERIGTIKSTSNNMNVFLLFLPLMK